MEFKEVVGRRRSIPCFQPWRPVEKEKIQIILEAARLASRAVNVDFYKAIVLYRDQLSKEDLDSLKTPTTNVQLDTAPVCIVWFADLSAVPRMVQAGGPTLKELVNVGALPPTHGWSHAYVDNVIVPQVLKPIADNPAVLAVITAAEAAQASCAALYAAVDEGLGTLLTALNAEAVKRITGHPDHLMLLWGQLVGYPAESWEAGGQRPREPFEQTSFEMRYGNPFPRDPKVVEKLKEAKMIQDPAPLPWRQEEIRYLAQMFGLPL
jgi:nitroreductase